MTDVTQHVRDWIALTRLDKPIGNYLLLWPTLWALWIAGDGQPSIKNVVIFVLGVFLMRAAGCIINDYADRNIDTHVKRTEDRPIANGRIAPKHALIGFVIVCLVAFALVLLTDRNTVLLSFGGVALAALYPFMKRVTHFPQVVLGAAFSWAIVMAFMAEQHQVTLVTWLLYAANLAWTVAYDTEYAMVDRDDDVRIGVKSTAIAFGRFDTVAIGLLNTSCLILFGLAAYTLNLSGVVYMAIALSAALMLRQQVLIHQRERMACFQAFRESHWAGFVLWLGLLAHYMTV